MQATGTLLDGFISRHDAKKATGTYCVCCSSVHAPSSAIASNELILKTSLKDQIVVLTGSQAGQESGIKNFKHQLVPE
jgi:hypothetical protein